ncbi:MAG: hypothetical protein ACJAVV_001545 [Alphaproteobacteria bacterium]|jgi:hypothetical protein
MYRYAGSLKAELLLNEIEYYQTQTFQIIWLGVAIIGGISIILAMTLPLEIVPFCGFAYSLMLIWFLLIRRHRSKQWQLRSQS